MALDLALAMVLCTQDDEGEERSEAGAAGAACGGDETEGDSFMVDDGYLSEDEGMAAEGEEGARSPGAGEQALK